MKKEKAFPRRRKERTFSLHSTATNHANDETEEKEEHLQFFFSSHPQNKTTENLNLRIEEATLKTLKKNVCFDVHL